MWQMKPGEIEICRVEEMLTPGFDPAFQVPDYDPEILNEHPELAGTNIFDRASGKLMSSTTLADF
jgi:hypothetical protein